MAAIFRAMLQDGRFPKVESTAKGLGVRTEGGRDADIPVLPSGRVLPSTGGMSVAPTWMALPYHRIPKRLKAKFPRATGSDQMVCWRMGEGEFVESLVSERLILKPDSPMHGTVQPRFECMLVEYEQALAATRELWINIETVPGWNSGSEVP